MKATSKVIAHVYHSRYGEPNEGPKAAQLKQLVLEDLRVSASYMKCHRAKDQAIDITVGKADDSYLGLAAYFEKLKHTNPGNHTAIETEPDVFGETRYVYSFLAFGASIQGFRRVERIIADSNALSIISDRHLSILKAKAIVFPKAHHGACIVHIMRNAVSRYKSKGLAKLIKQASPSCHKYLAEIGTSKWSRTFFLGNRYNLLTSNVAEQLNNALKKSRSSPIVELYMFIQRMLTRWFSARRTKSIKQRGAVTPEVAIVMDTHIRLTQGIALEAKACSCQVFQKLKIPCGHALLVADSIGLPHVQLLGDCYKTQTWIDTYSAAIYSEAPDGDIPIPPAISNLNLQPPNTRRPSGRPKDKRIPSGGDLQVPKKTKPNKCSRCGQSGHNRTNCVVTICCMVNPISTRIVFWIAPTPN
ncbi:MULE transposase domain-containing protein [Hirschfeldia incana]|nr:MULE transposase domain-containing protein [Hirschfeldia incana]